MRLGEQILGKCFNGNITEDVFSLDISKCTQLFTCFISWHLFTFSTHSPKRILNNYNYFDSISTAVQLCLVKDRLMFSLSCSFFLLSVWR